jgi:hypothetical protein
VQRKRCRAVWAVEKEKDPDFGEVLEKKREEQGPREATERPKVDLV